MYLVPLILIDGGVTKIPSPEQKHPGEGLNFTTLLPKWEIQKHWYNYVLHGERLPDICMISQPLLGGVLMTHLVDVNQRSHLTDITRAE